MLGLIKRLTAVFGVCGDVDDIRELIIDEIKEKIDDYEVDAIGNLIAFKRGRAEKKVLLAANMDTIGVLATHILNNGLIKFATVAIKNPIDLYGQRIIFKNGTIGVIVGDERSLEKKNFYNNLFIDIGSNNKEEVAEVVNVGDLADFFGETTLIGNKIMSRSLNNRVGCAVLIKTLNELVNTNCEVNLAFTSQGASGNRSINTVISKLNPDIVIQVDCTAARAIEEVDDMSIELDRGPVIKMNDEDMLYHPKIIKQLKEAALKNTVDLQIEVSDTMQYKGGIYPLAVNTLVGKISIPCKYLCSPNEIISIQDAISATEVLKNFIMYCQ